MEIRLSEVVVVADGQARRSGFLTPQPAQRINLGRRTPMRHIELADGCEKLFEVPSMLRSAIFSVSETRTKLAAFVWKQDGNVYERPVTGRVRLSRAEPARQGDPHV
jgi:hypothetical protein